jgi:hypothetical protein
MKGITVAIVVGVAAIIIGGAVVVIDIFDDNKGPDSGEEIDLSDEPNSPDSGEEVDLSDESNGPDSGEEIDNQGPDSGEEIDLTDEPSSPDSGEEVDPNEPTSPDSGEEISLSDDLKNRAKGSCNVISDGSTCVEYIGSWWTSTNAKNNCAGTGVFSINACPRPSIGGCRIGAGSANEIVTWHYNYGGDPYTPELVPYASRACKALPGGQWVE